MITDPIVCLLIIMICGLVWVLLMVGVLRSMRLDPR